MVEPIGTRPRDRIAGVSRVTTPAAAAGVTKQLQAAPTPTVAAQLSASAPVDVERVAKIKEAIAKGTFPLSPSTIADALIAARYEWMSNDKA